MRKCDLFLLDCGDGVPEWEEGDHFWNETMESGDSKDNLKQTLHRFGNRWAASSDICPTASNKRCISNEIGRSKRSLGNSNRGRGERGGMAQGLPRDRALWEWFRQRPLKSSLPSPH